MIARLKCRKLPSISLTSVVALVSLHVSPLLAQIPAPPPDPELNAGPALNAAPAFQGGGQEPEALLRGPVHEAFAEPYAADPQPGLIVAKQPPAAIEELPPEERPEGDNVRWIPGYWGWDDAREDFVWISGIWRATPPNHRWVPGYWFQTNNGYQWVAGTWLRETAEEIEYLAEAPPQSLELGPVGTAPGDNYFWIPGCWTWGGSNYLWRPGYWSLGYSNWLWVPARYYWTPYGYAYCRGYWDYPFVNRGYLFAPYYFPNRTYVTAGFRFTPGISLSVGLLTNNFWVSARYGHYFFGDYYSNYNRFGFQPWHTYHNTRHCYDPIFAYNQRHYHGNGNWNGRNGGSNYYQFVNNNFQQRVDNRDFRPPHTWSEQIARYGKDGPGRNGDHARPDDHNRFENSLGQSWRDVATKGRDGDGNRPGSPKFTKLNETQRDQLLKQANSYRQLSEHRRDTEAKLGGGRPNLDGKKNIVGGKNTDSPKGSRVPSGNQIVGDTGNGIQNRFRLPTPDGTTRVGKDFDQPGDKGNRPNFGRNQGTGDISTSLRDNKPTFDITKEGFRNRTGQSGNKLGSQDPGISRSDNKSGVGTRAQSFQDALDNTRRERDGSGGSTKTGNTLRNSNPSTGSGNSFRSEFDRSQSSGSKLGRSQFDGNRSGKTGADALKPSFNGTPGNTFTPRSNRSGNIPGTTNGMQRNSVQDAIERARRATTNSGNFNPKNSGSTTRTLSPPGGNSGTFSPPSGNFRSNTPPSGNNRSFKPPGGSNSFDRGTMPRNSGAGGNGGTREFRKGSSTNTGPQGNPTFRSGNSNSNNFGSSANQGKNPSFGGNRGGNSSGKSGTSARSFSPPSDGGSTPSMNRFHGSSSRSSSGFNGPTGGGSSDSGNSSKSRRGR